MVSTSITRNAGVTALALVPAASRKMVFSSERAVIENFSWKPEAAPVAVRTSTLSSASSTTRGAGIGTMGPISRLS